MKVELYLSHYVTKTGLKNITVVKASKSAQKVDLASLKSGIHK